MTIAAPPSRLRGVKPKYEHEVIQPPEAPRTLAFDLCWRGGAVRQVQGGWPALSQFLGLKPNTLKAYESTGKFSDMVTVNPDTGEPDLVTITRVPGTSNYTSRGRPKAPASSPELLRKLRTAKAKADAAVVLAQAALTVAELRQADAADALQRASVKAPDTT